MKKLLHIFFTLIVSVNLYAQCDYANFSNAPKELFRKRVKEEGMRYGNPYTMFVKGVDFNLIASLNQIRNNIRKGTPEVEDKLEPYSKLYKEIWDYANNYEPGKCPEDAECNHPVWVKNNAIVYLIGLRATLVGGKIVFDSMIPAGCHA